MHRAVVYLLAATACTPHARAATPVELYGALPRIENVAVSPDGAQVAFVRTEGDERFLTVVFITLKREDHWLSRAETRVRMLRESVAFLRLHNPPD